MSFLNVYLCRLCLCGGDRLIDIFKDNDFLEFVVQDVIEDLLHVQVKRLEGFPWLICSSCLGKLTEFRFFKIRCLECKVTFESRFPDCENLPRVFLGSDSSGISSPCNWYSESPAYLLKEDIKREDSESAAEVLDGPGGGGCESLVGNCGSEPVFLKTEAESNESQDGQYISERVEAEHGGNSHATAAQENWQGGIQMAPNGVSSQMASEGVSSTAAQENWQGGIRMAPNGVLSQRASEGVSSTGSGLSSQMASNGALSHSASNGLSSQTVPNGGSSQAYSQPAQGRGTGRSRRGRGRGRRAAAGKQCAGHGMDVGITRCDACDEHSDKGSCGVTAGCEDAAADSEDDEVWLSGPKRKRAALQRWYWELERLRSKTEQAKSDAENTAVASLPRDELPWKGNSQPQSMNSDLPAEGQWFGGMPKIVNVSSSTTMKPFQGRARKIRCIPTGGSVVGGSLRPSGNQSAVAHKEVLGRGIAINNGVGKMSKVGVLKGCGGVDRKVDSGTVEKSAREVREALKRKVMVGLAGQESKSLTSPGSKSVAHTASPQVMRGVEVGVMRKMECKLIGKEVKDVVTISDEEDSGTVPRGNPMGERPLTVMKRSKGNGADRMGSKIWRGVSKVVTYPPHKLVRAAMASNQVVSHSLPDVMKFARTSERGFPSGEIKNPASASRVAGGNNVGIAESTVDSVSCQSVLSSGNERVGICEKVEIDSTVKRETKEFAPVYGEEHSCPSMTVNESHNTGVRPLLVVKSSLSDPPVDDSANLSATMVSEGLSGNFVSDDNFPSTNHVINMGDNDPLPSVGGESMVEEVNKVDSLSVLGKSDRLAPEDLSGVSHDSSQIASGDGVVTVGDMVSVEQTEGLATVLLENKVGAGSSLALSSVAGGNSKSSSSALICEDAGDGTTSVVAAGDECGTDIKVSRLVSSERAFLAEGCDRSADVSAEGEIVGTEDSRRRVLRPRTKSGRFCKRERRSWSFDRAIREVPQDAKDEESGLDFGGEEKDC